MLESTVPSSSEKAQLLRRTHFREGLMLGKVKIAGQPIHEGSRCSRLEPPFDLRKVERQSLFFELPVQFLEHFQALKSTSFTALHTR